MTPKAYRHADLHILITPQLIIHTYKDHACTQRHARKVCLNPSTYKHACLPCAQVPPVLLGYTQLSERPPCVTLHMSLRPRLAPPPAVPEAVLSGEVEEVTRHART